MKKKQNPASTPASYSTPEVRVFTFYLCNTLCAASTNAGTELLNDEVFYEW